jgi:LysM repeat protein
MNKAASKYLTLITLLLTVIHTVWLPSDIFAQEPVPVEVSKQLIVSEGRVYYVHQVRKGQTVYSIAKAYNVTVNQIIAENNIYDNGIREGQILKIPVSGIAQSEKKDSVVGVSNVAGEQQRQTVMAGKQKPAVITPDRQDERYLYHIVKKGESLASIAAEYGISVRDLRKANKGLLFPHEGDTLLIPRRKISPRYTDRRTVVAEDTAAVTGEIPDTTVTPEEPEKFTVPSEKTVLTVLHGSVRVAVLLPFFLEENSARSYIDSTKRDAQGRRIYREVTMPGDWVYEGSVPFLETYEGILIAADSLRSLGLSIELDVYDTGADSSKISKLIWSGMLDNDDLIIGPVFSYNIDHLASFALQHDIPVVSPVPLRDQNILRNRPSLYRVYPTARVSQEILINEIKSHPGSNIVFIYSDTLMSDPGTSEFWSRLTTETACGNPDDTTLITPLYFTGRVSNRDAYSSVTSIDTLLKPDRENLIVLATTQTPVVSAAFSTLHSLSRKYDIKVLGYPEIRGLETIDLKYYYDLELYIPSESYIDFNKPASEAFSTAFLKKFRTEPMAESFAWRGFDIAWYFIGGIASYGHDFLRDPGLFNPDLLCLEPDFRRDSRDDGYENRGMFIFHYKKDGTIEVRRSRTEQRSLVNDYIED